MDDEEVYGPRKTPKKGFGPNIKGKTPTSEAVRLRYKIVAAKMIKKGMSVKKAMLAAGYTPATTDRKRAEIIQKPEFREEFRKVMNEEKLLGQHLNLYGHKKWRHTRTESFVDETGKRITKKIFEETGEPDIDVILKALDMAHKIRGDYDKGGAPSTKDSSKIYNIFYDEGVKEKVADFENMIKAKIYEESIGKDKSLYLAQGGNVDIQDIKQTRATGGDGENNEGGGEDSER